MPDAARVDFQSTTANFSNRFVPAEVLASAAPARGRKRLRRPKARLPVAEEVDVALVQNAPPAGMPLPAAPPPAAPAAPLAPSPLPVLAFDGGADDTNAIPPDTMGSVSDHFVFNPLNNNIHIFDRAGTSLSQTTLDAFWNVFPQPMDAFDPRSVYDPIGRRFIFVSTANAESRDSALLVAVSETDDPTGNWFTGFVVVDPVRQGDVWLDFPSVGFTEDKITVQVNLYELADNDFAGSSIYVWDKAQFYSGNPAPAVEMFVLRDQGGTQVPAVTLDPGQQTQYLVSRWTGDFKGSGYYNVHEITGSVSGGTLTLTTIGFVQTPGTTWSANGGGDFAPQAGTPQLISAGDDRVLSVVLRGQSLWFANAAFLPAGGPTRVAGQWAQVNLAGSTLQQIGRVDDPSGVEFYAFPTLAVNSVHDALIGFAHFSAATFGSGGYALRRAGDPAGTMRAPVVFAPGGNTYYKRFGGPRNRWGDYSSTQADPLDDLSFWTVQERASDVPDTWATRWARVT